MVRSGALERFQIKFMLQHNPAQSHCCQEAMPRTTSRPDEISDVTTTAAVFKTLFWKLYKTAFLVKDGYVTKVF
jgi:hypothetical protein